MLFVRGGLPCLEYEVALVERVDAIGFIAVHMARYPECEMIAIGQERLGDFIIFGCR